jgi:hypothetical protein
VSAARHGWILEWFVKDEETFVDRTDVTDMTVERLQNVFDEPSADNMMCFSYRVGAEHVEALRRHVGSEIDLHQLTILYREGLSAASGHRVDSTRPLRIPRHLSRVRDACAP